MTTTARHESLIEAITHCPEIARLIDAARQVADHHAFVQLFGHDLYNALREFDAVYPDATYTDDGYSDDDVTVF